MQVNFKVGDKVKVVRGTYRGGELIVGAIHTVHELYETDDYPYVSLLIGGNKISSGWDIDRFVKYEEKEKTLKVEMGKKYRMVGTHEPVRIICVDRQDPRFTCVGLYPTGEIETPFCFDNQGQDHYGRKIVEEVPAVDWSKVKTDTPIWVKHCGDLVKRHFNKFDGKYVYFYTDGTTSFTCHGCVPALAVSVDNCWLTAP